MTAMSDGAGDCFFSARLGWDPEDGVSRALDLWQAAQTARDERGSAEASMLIAWFSFQISSVETGLSHALAARRFFAEAGLSEREALATAVYAWLLLEIGMTEEAVDEALKALAAAELLDEAQPLNWALNVTAVVFWACKQVDRAQALSERAVALARASGDPRLLAWWLINLGGIVAEHGYQRGVLNDDAGLDARMQEAIEINAEAIDLAGIENDAWGLKIALCNAAEYQIARGDLAGAERSLARWDAAAPAGPRTEAQYLYTRGLLSNRQGRPEEALATCERALAVARRYRNIDGEAHALRFMSEIHEGLGRFDRALACFKRFHDVQSTLMAEKVQRRARVTEIHYETARFKHLAVEAGALAQELARTTRLDPLTGLGNRRALDEAFVHLVTRAAPFSLAIFDLDHFKRINDRFSHAAGDTVLRRFGEMLQGAIRERDVAIRLGGEEFVVILMGSEREGAVALCRRIIEGLAALSWDEINPGLRVTTSIGIAGHGEAAGPAEVLALADQRLYLAKNGGRNRIVASSHGLRLVPAEPRALAS